MECGSLILKVDVDSLKYTYTLGLLFLFKNHNQTDC